MGPHIAYRAAALDSWSPWGRWYFLAHSLRSLVTVRGAAGIQLASHCRCWYLIPLTYDKVQQLYFQNPTFGFYLLRLTTERLLQNLARLEARLVARELASGPPLAPEREPDKIA